MVVPDCLQAQKRIKTITAVNNSDSISHYVTQSAFASENFISFFHENSNMNIILRILQHNSIRFSKI